ncbi:sarcosine oxidase subunit gamma [Arthrobacter sp. Sa2CUA1]|uniref:Sarcosine oxidase subunit gamma n=1 Tax=Arthrobacter gallicola TaxID=2762225 RepID=A0ABR8UVM1_9MICC|nr:sarcosine oxidase subunit gamma family protein [Arthrobacter gallicola]MBD7996422.1 sarcosine oxidase subunit gamma [Arthrobacter gallicola]
MADTAALSTAEIQTLRQSPAALLSAAFDAGSVAGTVELRELPFLTMVGIRVDPASAAGMDLGTFTGGLPAASGIVRTSGDTSVLWLGPAEFLLVAAPESHDSLGGEFPRALIDTLGSGAGQVVDLSANRTTFELSGRRARSVLEKGCSLDLHSRVFNTGTALSTEIGGIPAILWKTDEETYRILPRASFSQFLGRWLLDAMREYASDEVP